MFDPHLTAAEWYLEGLSPENLPEFAREALGRGYDGKNLSQLAALVNPTKRDVEGLVQGAFRELDVAAPLSKDDAALWMLGSVKAGAASDDITSRSMVGQLLKALPELEKQYVEELKSYYGLPGNYWVFAVILKPAIQEQIAKENWDCARRFSVFIEQVCSAGDEEARNVLWIEIFEWLVHSDAGELKSLWPILGPATKVLIKKVASRRGETTNIPK